MSQRIKLLGACCVFGMTALLGACNQDSAPKPTQETAPQAVFRVATDGAFAPFNYTQADGSLAGFDIDLANALCTKMQMTCDIKAHDWDGIIPALKTGKYDAIIGAMAVTPERQLQVDFSDTYFSSPLIFVAKKQMNFDPADSAQIDSANIGVQRATSASDWLAKHHPTAKVKLYDTLDNSLMDLGAGRVEASLADKMAVITWLKSDLGKDFEIKGEDINVGDNVAIAINKDNPELLNKLNQALIELRADGTYDKLVIQHFGEESLSSQKTLLPSTQQ